MGARAGTGIEINLDLVPQREMGMTAYEMMLSESQERMLIVAARGHDRQVAEIFHKWDLDAVTIGHVTDTKRLRVLHKGEVVADIPNSALTDDAPKYNRPQSDYPHNTNDVAANIHAGFAQLAAEVGADNIYNEALLRLLATPNIASKQWVYRQYDHMVRTNTTVLPGSDAAVIRVKETRKALAMSVDCNGRYCYLNPKEGAKLAVAESARNVVCSGAKPLAITNCLNFPSPERPEVMRSFVETLEGMGEVCRALGTPVTGGNVSFYNETEGRGIYPTPVIGMLGLIEDPRHTTTQWFKAEGEVILLLGETRADFGGSELLALFGAVDGAVPTLDLAAELAVQKTCLAAIQAGWIRSAHDCSEGGLAVALAESCFSHNAHPAIGAHIELHNFDAPQLFAETPSRIVASVKPEHLEQVQALASQHNIPCEAIGKTGGSALTIAINGRTIIHHPIEKLEQAWRETLPKALDVPHY
jgi:phosphoribosylformylglycinamidine synthase